jgi:threonine dehydrogenase-like Zn-dependent dehydrogenase
MRAFQISEPHKSRIVDLPEPQCTAGEVLLRVSEVGFCGSDLSTFLGKNPLVNYPIIPGHEISARIEALGEDVPESLKLGASVTVLPYSACGACSSCRRGRPNACRYNQTMGVQRDGAMTELVRIPWTSVAPDYGLRLDQLAMVEPLTVGFHAVDRAQVTDADTIAVIGCGMIGIGAIVRGVARGARVIAVDIDNEKLATALELGAAATVNSRHSDALAKIRELTAGAGADVVVEAVGNPVTYRLAVEAAAFCGRLACIGYAAEDAPIPTRLIVQKELDVRGSRNATYLDFQAASAYLAKGNFPFERVITRRVSLEEAGKALETWAEDPGVVTKILVAL